MADYDHLGKLPFAGGRNLTYIHQSLSSLATDTEEVISNQNCLGELTGYNGSGGFCEHCNRLRHGYSHCSLDM